MSIVSLAASISSGSCTAPWLLLATTTVSASVVMRTPVAVWVRTPPTSTLAFKADSDAPLSCRYSLPTAVLPTWSTMATRGPLMSTCATRPVVPAAPVAARVAGAVSMLPFKLSVVTRVMVRLPASRGSGGAARRSRSAASTKNCERVSVKSDAWRTAAAPLRTTTPTLCDSRTAVPLATRYAADTVLPFASARV